MTWVCSQVTKSFSLRLYTYSNPVTNLFIFKYKNPRYAEVGSRQKGLDMPLLLVLMPSNCSRSRRPRAMLMRCSSQVPKAFFIEPFRPDAHHVLPWLYDFINASGLWLTEPPTLCQ